MIRVGDDHDSGHRDGTQRVGAGCQGEGQQELVDLAGGVAQRPGEADGRVQGEGDEQQGEEVCQGHAEDECVQTVLTQGIVLSKKGEDQQVGTKAHAKDHSTGAGKNHAIVVTEGLCVKSTAEVLQHPDLEQFSVQFKFT